MRSVCWLFLLMASSVGAQEVYRWVDAKGRVHYGEEAPKEGSFERLSPEDLPHVHSSLPVQPQIPSRSTSTSRSQRRDVSSEGGRSSRTESVSVKACERYRAQLDAIQRQLRAGYKEPKGNALRERRRQIEAMIRKAC